jgi:prepilin-type N-terminal cleavage/methylation domain-containing protein
MSRQLRPSCNEYGFTLLEIIVTIIAAAILGALIFQYLGTSLIKSSVPIHRLQTSFSLKQVMENITEDYKQTPSDVNTLKTKIGAEGTDQDNDYGQYHVISNQFIKFSGNTAVQDDTGINDKLKVTIRNSLGETLTALFISG